MVELEFVAKISKSGNYYIIKIPLKLAPIAEKLHGKRVHVKIKPIEEQ